MPSTRQTQRPGTHPASDPAGAYRHLMAVRRRDRLWRVALVLVALAVVGVGVAAAAVTISHHLRSTASAHHGASAHKSSQQNSSRSTSSTTTTSPGSGSGPTISALSPNSGTAGTVVTITGSGLVSPDGQITAYFGSTAAPTTCASGSTCTTTVPSGSPGPETVTVQTASGTSDGLTFTYG